MKSQTIITLTNNLSESEVKVFKELLGSTELIKKVKEDLKYVYAEVFSDEDDMQIEIKLLEEK